MINAGLDAAILSPFLTEAENNLSDTNRDLPPTDPVTLDPYSEKYFQELVKALGHGHNRPNLLQLEHQFTKKILPVINIEKVVVADAPDTLQIPDTVLDSEEEYSNTVQLVLNLYHSQNLLLLHFTLVSICCNVLIIPLWYQKPVSLFIRSIPQLETSSGAMDV